LNKVYTEQCYYEKHFKEESVNDSIKEIYEKYKIPLPKPPVKEVIKYKWESKFSPIKSIKAQRSNIYKLP